MLSSIIFFNPIKNDSAVLSIFILSILMTQKVLNEDEIKCTIHFKVRISGF